MFFALTLALSAVVFIPAQAPEATERSFTAESEFIAKRPSAPELQARRWLGLIDFGRFDQSYNEAGEPLRAQYALEKWKFGMTLRMTKGKIQDRTLATALRTEEFGGRKGGEFEIITFASMFEHNNLQNERVVLEKIGEDWKVVDYEITPVKNRLK